MLFLETDSVMHYFEVNLDIVIFFFLLFLNDMSDRNMFYRTDIK